METTHHDGGRRKGGTAPAKSKALIPIWASTLVLTLPMEKPPMTAKGYERGRELPLDSKDSGREEGGT